MNDLFHQMSFSAVSSQGAGAPRLQVKEQIKKEWIEKLWTLHINFRPMATWLEKKSFFLQIFSESNQHQDKIYIFRSTVLSLTVLLGVLFEDGMVGVTDIASVCMFASSWGPWGPGHLCAQAPACTVKGTSANEWCCPSVRDASWWLCSFSLLWLTLNFLCSTPELIRVAKGDGTWRSTTRHTDARGEKKKNKQGAEWHW